MLASKSPAARLRLAVLASTIVVGTLHSAVLDTKDNEEDPVVIYPKWEEPKFTHKLTLTGGGATLRLAGDFAGDSANSAVNLSGEGAFRVPEFGVLSITGTGELTLPTGPALTIDGQVITLRRLTHGVVFRANPKGGIAFTVDKSESGFSLSMKPNLPPPIAPPGGPSAAHTRQLFLDCGSGVYYSSPVGPGFSISSLDPSEHTRATGTVVNDPKDPPPTLSFTAAGYTITPIVEIKAPVVSAPLFAQAITDVSTPSEVLDLSQGSEASLEFFLKLKKELTININGAAYSAKGMYIDFTKGDTETPRAFVPHQVIFDLSL